MEQLKTEADPDVSTKAQILLDLLEANAKLRPEPVPVIPAVPVASSATPVP